MLARGIALSPAELVYPVQANEAFVRVPDRALEALETDGFQFYRYGDGVIRLVTSFATTEADVIKFLAAAQVRLITYGRGWIHNVDPQIAPNLPKRGACD
jgi:threonine aldolase